MLYIFEASGCNEVKMSLVVKGHENVVDFRPGFFVRLFASQLAFKGFRFVRGIFYMDAMECKHVAELLSPSMACWKLSKTFETYHIYIKSMAKQGS